MLSSDVARSNVAVEMRGKGGGACTMDLMLSRVVGFHEIY